MQTEREVMEHSNLDFSDASLTCSQLPGSSSSLSLPSDVPDIRNLFSSYVYESPNSDSCDSIEVSISPKGVFAVTDLVGDEKERTEKKRNSCGFKKNEKIIEEISPRKDLYTDFALKIQSQSEDQDWCSHSLHSEPADVRNWFSSYVYESPPIDSNDEFGGVDTEYDQKGKDKLIFEESEGQETILGESRNTGSTNEETAKTKDNQCSNKSRLEEKTVETQRNDEFKGVLIEKQKEKVPENSPTPTKSSTNVEKEPKQILHPEGSSKREAPSEDGFIPIRKSEFTRSNLTNSVERLLRNGVHNSDSSSRSGLTDITNFGNSITREVIGNWKCPQKGKPNVGPPLKQLRLQQWVRKL